ncbi:MAG: adaptor protein MecA [Lachnospiraceae bacterium]|nr:adaptor protein MecA [Lachnospiraceae bacterium]
MKIEKINENQIRCTLNRADLEDREIKLSELAYGTEKAKDLFREMMQQASHQFGFEADNIPLMVEAIPLSPDCIVLIITKVEDPEELDSRFSKFSPTDDMEEIDGFDSTPDDFLPGIDEISNMFRNFKDELVSKIEEHTGRKVIEIEAKSAPAKVAEPEKNAPTEEKKADALPPNFTKLVKIFSFSSLKPLCDAAKIVGDLYHGVNTLYKGVGEHDASYYLLIHPEADAPENFSKVCNVLSEFGRTENSSYAYEAYFKEHCPVLIAEDALQKLSEV